MTSWDGKRPITVISACMARDGTPTFALSEVEVTHAEYENGVHYNLTEDRLADTGYEEPFVHFDELEAPSFLGPAVKEHLGLQACILEPMTVNS